MRDLFTDDNTEGYTEGQLDSLNAEWEIRVESLKLEEYTEKYNDEAKAFGDEVAGR